MAKQTLNVAVIGASGAIGSALVAHLSVSDDIEHVYAFSRHAVSYDSTNISYHFIDIEDETTITKAAEELANVSLDMIIVASGMLHNDTIEPEKSIKHLDADNFHKIYAVNTVGPALVAKHFAPLLPRERPSVMAFLSARVGSIGDNHMGGWYAYRASKAALNMIIKNLSIELGRKYKQLAVIGLHPGTVDSKLSAPFSGNVPKDTLFSADYSAGELLKVLRSRSVSDTGRVFDYAGIVIEN